MAKNITAKILKALALCDLNCAEICEAIGATNVASLRSTISQLVQRGLIETLSPHKCGECRRYSTRYKLTDDGIARVNELFKDGK